MIMACSRSTCSLVHESRGPQGQPPRDRHCPDYTSEAAAEVVVLAMEQDGIGKGVIESTSKYAWLHENAFVVLAIIPAADHTRHTPETEDAAAVLDEVVHSPVADVVVEAVHSHRHTSGAMDVLLGVGEISHLHTAVAVHIHRCTSETLPPLYTCGWCNSCG